MLSLEILAFTTAKHSAILLPTTSVVLASSMNPIQVSLPKNVNNIFVNEPMLDDDDDAQTTIVWRTTQHSTTSFRATKKGHCTEQCSKKQEMCTTPTLLPLLM